MKIIITDHKYPSVLIVVDVKSAACRLRLGPCFARASHIIISVLQIPKSEENFHLYEITCKWEMNANDRLTIRLILDRLRLYLHTIYGFLCLTKAHTLYILCSFID